MQSCLPWLGLAGPRGERAEVRGEATARRVTGGRELPCDPAPAVHGSMILSGPATGAAPATPAPAAAANPDCPLHCCHRSCLALAPWPPALPRRPRPPRTAGATTARTPHLVRFTSRCLPCHLLADTRHCSAADYISFGERSRPGQRWEPPGCWDQAVK